MAGKSDKRRKGANDDLYLKNNPFPSLLERRQFREAQERKSEHMRQIADALCATEEKGKMRATEMRNDLRRWAEAESLQQPESKPQPASVPAKGGKGS